MTLSSGQPTQQRVQYQSEPQAVLSQCQSQTVDTPPRRSLKSVPSSSYNDEGGLQVQVQDEGLFSDYTGSTGWRASANKYDVSTGARLTASFRRTLTAFYDPVESDEESSTCSENEDAFPPSSNLTDMDRTRTEPSVNRISSVPGRDASAGGTKCTFGKPDVFTEDDKLWFFK